MPIEVALLGIEADTRLLQLEKAKASIVVIPSGMIIEVSPLFEKAPFLIVVNVLGKVILFKDLQFSKAQVPIVVT